MSKELFEAVQSRSRPEDVAELILELGGKNVPSPVRTVLDQAARHSLKRQTYRYSSMAARFRAPDGAEKQVRAGARLFAVPPLSAAQCMDAGLVRGFCARLSEFIQYTPGMTDFKAHRHDRAAREKLGIVKGHRAYNKRFRYLTRLEDKITRLARSEVKYEHSRMAKSAFATHLTQADLDGDFATAAFVAYLTSRMNLRSQFTNTSQIRAYDNVAEALLRWVSQSPTANWWAVAHVHPEKEVLRHLSDESKGKLLAMWYDSLLGIAEFLEGEATRNRIDLGKMVVHRGQDSSTWNATAGAWNKVRSAWMDVLHDLGAEVILDALCPGKVMRLMAADVVRWSTRLHPDTHVWTKLPAPWKVMRGEERCTRQTVMDACQASGVDPKGWCLPRSAKKATTFSVTPELVHGVTVSSPAMAQTLRKIGVFSGKTASGEVPYGAVVERDLAGFVVGVVDSDE